MTRGGGITAGGAFARPWRRACVYGGFSFLFAIVQTTVFRYFPVFGQTPDLLLCAVLGAAVLEGPEWGGVLGIWGGFLSCALGGASTLFIPVYFLGGAFAGELAARTLGKNFPSYLIFSAAGCGLRAMLSLLLITRGAGIGYDLRAIFTATLIPEFSADLCAAVVTYPVFRWQYRLARQRGVGVWQD